MSEIETGNWVGWWRKLRPGGPYEFEVGRVVDISGVQQIGGRHLVETSAGTVVSVNATALQVLPDASRDHVS